MAAESRVLAFYRGTGKDNRGRWLRDLQAADDAFLEAQHDYIQWLFPLPEPSRANAEAPILTAEDIEAIGGSAELKERLVDSLRTMLHFYGFELHPLNGHPRVVRSDSFAARARDWVYPFSHNFLRITRILRSLSLLGCAEHAVAFLHCLEDVYAENQAAIGDEVLGYWQRAVEP